MVSLRRLSTLGVTLALLAVLPLASANHPQPLPSGGSVSFRDKAGGNEWWVEAIVTSTSPISKVEVMDDGGPWATMTHRPEWGSWALGYHVEPGHRVTFRATTAAGVVTSCPFTHPAGVEQCPTTTPPPAPPGRWSSQGIAVFGGFPNDMAVGDPDQDGRREVYVATSDALYRLAPVRTTVSANGAWLHVAIGDADRDGKAELYATRIGESGPWELHRFTYSGGWVDQVVATGDHLSGPMSFGDVDRDGRPELYVAGQAPEDFTKIAVSQVFLSGGTWQVRRVAAIQDDTTFGTSPVSLWVGDADGDAQAEIVLTTAGKPGYFLDVVDFTTTWTTQQVDSLTGPGYAVAGDLGDGTRAIALLDSTGALYRYTKSGGTWSSAFLATVPGGWGKGLFLGDGDGDGRVELYASSNDDHVYQVRVAGTAAAVTDMGVTQSSEDLMERVIVGDGDNDGRPEVYVAAFDGDIDAGHVYQYDFLPPEPQAFDATFTGVRGNEWWIQANVAASGGTVGKVDVRLNEGDWRPLAKQSWGGWAASHHAVQGTVVQLRATSTTGAVDLSDCYRWIPASGSDAAKTTCPSTPPPPPPGGFDATFSNVKGNEWWVEAVITANGPVRSVFVYVGDCTGEPADMAYRADWGKWVLGAHVPAGTKVVFQANGDGGSDRSGGYVWPQATPTSGC